MNNKYAELEDCLLTIKNTIDGSDGITYAVSHLLTEAGVYHQCRVGCVKDSVSQHYTLTHCWVELAEGWCIDLTLRRWLGEGTGIPQGVFRFADYPRVQYYGLPLLVPKLEDDVLCSLTDYRYARVARSLRQLKAA